MEASALGHDPGADGITYEPGVASVVLATDRSRPICFDSCAADPTRANRIEAEARASKAQSSLFGLAFVVSREEAAQAQSVAPRFESAVVARLCSNTDSQLWLGAPTHSLAQPIDTLPCVRARLCRLGSLDSDAQGLSFYGRVSTGNARSSENAAAAADLMQRVMDDDIVRHLAACLRPAFQQPAAMYSLFIELAASALQAHVASLLALQPNGYTRRRGGLAPWQERRATEMLLASFDRQLPLADLAAACKLSLSHFVRAFRQSTGLPPHRWLMQRRVEMSKELLADSQHSLADVALTSGFADQSHFTRMFSRVAGMTPGAWRRFSGN